MTRRLLELKVENFRSLRNVTLPLGPLNVLVGPNGAGKTNVIEVFRFLADVARGDLTPAIDARAGFDQIVYRGTERADPVIGVRLRAAWTEHSTPNTPDIYTLRIKRSATGWSRAERFRLPQSEGRLDIEVVDGSMVVKLPGGQEEKSQVTPSASRLADQGLLPHIGIDEFAVFRRHVMSARVFDIDVSAARSAVRYQGTSTHLTDAADNLAAVLANLKGIDGIAWGRLVEDARVVLPQLDHIEFHYPAAQSSQPGRGLVEVVLRERGLDRVTPLADASLGTIRLLGLLALLYDPDPPVLTCIEEVDHGLHPQALEMLVNRLREASERTQLIVTTHSPTLANRLKPEEIVVCERNEDGSSAIPAISVERIKEIVEASEGLPLGDLWFSGSLGGDL